MKPSSASVRPRVDVVYAPSRWAASQSATVAMWKIGPDDQKSRCSESSMPRSAS